MKKLILTTLLMGAAMVGAVKATTLADVSVEGGVSYSTLRLAEELALGMTLLVIHLHSLPQ